MPSFFVCNPSPNIHQANTIHTYIPQRGKEEKGGKGGVFAAYFDHSISHLIDVLDNKHSSTRSGSEDASKQQRLLLKEDLRSLISSKG